MSNKAGSPRPRVARATPPIKHGRTKVQAAGQQLREEIDTLKREGAQQQLRAGGLQTRLDAVRIELAGLRNEPLRRAPTDVFLHQLAVCLDVTGVDDERLEAMSGEWPRIQRWLDAAAGVASYRKHLPKLLMIGADERRRLQHRHVTKPHGRPQLVGDAQVTEARALQRDALACARCAEDLADQLSEFGEQAEKALGEELTRQTATGDRPRRDDEDSLQAWIRTVWKLTRPSEGLPKPEPTVVERLRSIARVLRAAPQERVEAPITPRRRGAPKHAAVDEVRRAMIEHAPGRWGPTYRAKVVAAVLFASGLQRTFNPAAERAALPKL